MYDGRHGPVPARGSHHGGQGEQRNAQCLLTHVEASLSLAASHALDRNIVILVPRMRRDDRVGTPLAASFCSSEVVLPA
jgi:hypothetical protein